MDGNRDAELYAFLPDGVVVVGTVEREYVYIVTARSAWRRGAFDETVEHRGTEAEGANRILELLNRLLRGMHGDHGRGGKAVLQSVELLGEIEIDRPASVLSERVVSIPDEGQTDARVEN